MQLLERHEGHREDGHRIREAITIPAITNCAKAGTGCGGCCAPAGEVAQALAAALKALVAKGTCPRFADTRRELFDIVRVKSLKTFPEVLAAVGTGEGCEVCKPIIASITAGVWYEHTLNDGQNQMQVTNDRLLASTQKTGTYSVIP